MIADLPDNASMAAAALVVTGTVTIKTTVLMTPEEVDEAAQKSPIIARRDSKCAGAKN